MYRSRTTSSLFAGSVALILPISLARAVPTNVTAFDTPHCDPLIPMNFVHELGDAPVFPTNELLLSAETITQQSACPSHDNPLLINTRIRIVNLSGLFWQDMHYVADINTATTPGTSISNEDGIVNGGQAFRIDTVGVNTPLQFESITANGIFEPGEVWDFIIDDYMHVTGSPATPFDSIGVGGFSAGLPSTGSIIATEVPEPGALAYASVLGAALLSRRRRARTA
jgi:hypothetical protein